MRILYIFPHPDDETFGPAGGIHSQAMAGHEVYLLTLTKGGATKQRHRLGLSVEEMGEVRYKEMLNVAKVLHLKELRVLDMPDSGLKEMDPRKIEEVIAKHIADIKPEIIVSYPVHGISGFHDHLVTHAVVKRVYLQMKDEGADYLRRLAFITIKESADKPEKKSSFSLQSSPEELVDCIIDLKPENRQALIDALACYESYQEVIQASKVAELAGDIVAFEIFQEEFNPPLDDLCAELP